MTLSKLEKEAIKEWDSKFINYMEPGIEAIEFFIRKWIKKSYKLGFKKKVKKL